MLRDLPILFSARLLRVKSWGALSVKNPSNQGWKKHKNILSGRKKISTCCTVTTVLFLHSTVTFKKKKKWTNLGRGLQ